MSSSGGQSPDIVNIQRNEGLFLPSRETDQLLAIRRSQFDGLKRAIERCEAPTASWISNAAWCSIGVGATAALSLVAFATAQDLPAWVMPFYVIATVAAFILGIILLLLHRREERRAHQDISVVREEIQHLEAQYKSVGRSTAAQSEPCRGTSAIECQQTANNRQDSS